MNPRLSISGRMSVDGWNGAGGTSIGGGPGHARRASGQRPQTLFSAFDDELAPADSVGLERLPEVEEGDDYDDDVDERTHLRSDLGRSRSSSHSPRGSQGDARRSPH